MEQFFDILNARAKLFTDGTPEFKFDHNGVRLSIEVETREEYDTATEAIAAGRELMAELLAVDGWVPVSGAGVGAEIEAAPKRLNGPKGRWRGKVHTRLVTEEQFAEERQHPFTPVHGILDD